MVGRRARTLSAAARPALRSGTARDARSLPAAGAPRGTFVFIHGGYWRALDKDDVAFVAAPFVEQGIAVANVNYDLCPAVSIAAIVDECRRAVAWTAREGPKHGAAADSVVVGGHSAGGHLAAMMNVTDWSAYGFAAPPFRARRHAVRRARPRAAACSSRSTRISGSTRRKPLRMSPVAQPLRAPRPLLMACGGGETSEFLRQTQLLWDAWPQVRPPGGRAADRSRRRPLQRPRGVRESAKRTDARDARAVLNRQRRRAVACRRGLTTDRRSFSLPLK